MQSFLHKYRINDETILIFEDANGTFSVIGGFHHLKSSKKVFDTFLEVMDKLPKGITHLETTGLD